MTSYRLVGGPPVVVLSDEVINDRRMSPADLGIYVRFAYAATMWHDPDLDLLVREFHMPREETEAALLRLVALGHLDAVRERGTDESSD